MKSIKQQYIDLVEGKMSQANFMRNIRMIIPQYITNVTSFSDSIKILKNKGILTEVNGKSPLTINGKIVKTYTQNDDKSYNVEYDNGDTETIMINNDSWNDINTLRKNATGLDGNQPSEEELDAMIKKMEDEIAGREAVNAQHDPIYEGHLTVDGINEAKERKGSSGKEQYSKFNDIQKDNIQELTLGIKFEHECFPKKTYGEIVKIVTKNIKKEPLYYTYFKLTGVRDYKPESMDNTNTSEVMAMKPVKDGNLVDQKRGMKKVKIVK